MSRGFQFCFHPTPKDRVIWAIVAAIQSLALLVSIIWFFCLGQWVTAILNVVAFIVNAFNCWGNVVIYLDWKNKS